jgi:prephenate dehydrogenase
VKTPPPKAARAAPRKTVIAGVGLIGASLAAAGKRAGALGRVVGIGRSAPNLAVALRAKIVDETAHDLEAAASDADLVVLAAPADACIELLERAVRSAPAACLFTDVASVKAPRCAAAGRLGVGARFVGAHPIAGGTATGAAAADADLFRNRVVVLTPTAETAPGALAAVTALWRATGAETVELDAGVHDRVLALTSHLPQMLASALAALAADSEDAQLVRRLSGAGFRDTTRIAQSDAAMWTAIARSNREHLLSAMDAFARAWSRLRDAVADGDDEALRALIAKGARFRRGVEEP